MSHSALQRYPYAESWGHTLPFESVQTARKKLTQGTSEEFPPEQCPYGPGGPRDNLDENAARVFCAWLGLEADDAAVVRYPRDRAAVDTPVWIGNLSCGPTVLRIGQCQFAHDGRGGAQCPRNEDLGVVCGGESGRSWWMIGAAALAVALVVTGICCCVHRRRQQQKLRRIARQYMYEGTAVNGDEDDASPPRSAGFDAVSPGVEGSPAPLMGGDTELTPSPPRATDADIEAIDLIAFGADAPLPAPMAGPASAVMGTVVGAAVVMPDFGDGTAGAMAGDDGKAYGTKAAKEKQAAPLPPPLDGDAERYSPVEPRSPVAPAEMRPAEGPAAAPLAAAAPPPADDDADPAKPRHFDPSA